MGITDFFSDLLSSVSFVQEVHAEAPAEDDDSKEGGDDESKDEEEEGAGEEEDSKEGGDDDEGDEGEEEEEEEEEEEPVDPKPVLEEECARSAQCAGYKHHFDACVERVTAQQENPDEHQGPKEDCVEEFFHLQHCATACAAPKLFKQLK